MKFFRKTARGIFKTFLNFPAWFGAKQFKNNTSTLFQSVKGNFVVKKTARRESFAEAIERLHLTEEDLQQRSKGLLVEVTVYLLLTIAITCYVIYLITMGYILAAGLGFLVIILTLTKAFIAHFQYFQIKNRKLGCSLKEWLNSKTYQ